ncbi:penicillin-binding protein activator [bacterium]|nr:penicillin-binding protein activator [bacterium]
MLILRHLKLIFFVGSVLLLSQCTKVATDSHLQVNQQLASPYSMPASAYMALAKNQTGSERQSLLIMAAGRLIYDGQWQQGLRILSQTESLSDELLKEKNLLLAKVDLIREQPHAAIAKLATVRDVSSLPIYYQVQFHEMLAYSYQLVGHPSESVVERIKLESLLPDEASKANNRRALWLSLTSLPKPELDTLAAESSDTPILQGWMQLALISRQSYENPDIELAQIAHWQAQYPQHPANRILPSPLDTVKTSLFAPPKQIALLLPISGPLAGPGGAIKDGFMAAYEASGSSNFVKVRVYDTNQVNVSALYQQALTDGAQYVIGPLSKTDVATIAKENHPVPTLLLNDLDASTKGNAYQFGLSPSNEARQVAARARKNGYSRALVITPTGAWGDDVVSAFANQWRASGGHIVDTLHYGLQDDLNTAVRNILQVSDSEAREKQLKRLLGSTIESTPTRRQDFDMIFLLAYPTKARQIMPLLKYYYAGDVPVYATSSVYAGSANTMKDRDLNGIIFCDMPWIFTHQMGSRNWPEQFNSYNRLYALGLDSYALSNQLNQLLLFPALGVSDKSGVLYLNPTHQIARILTFGQFRQGLAQLM